MTTTKNYIIEIEDAIGVAGSILPSTLVGYAPIPGIFTQYECYSGGYCVVYTLSCPGKPNKCIRLWHKQFEKDLVITLSEQIRRLHESDVDFVMEYEYFENGLRLNDGEIVPAIVMDWIEGDSIMEYIKKHHSKPDEIKRLADEFYSMVGTMHRKRIAHGDLSSGNIMVRNNGKLVLIDYDSFYFPELGSNIKQPIVGTSGYQHPERAKIKYLSSKIDNFSQQVIYLTLLAIKNKPAIANDDSLICDYKMLFDEKDFADDKSFVSSNGYKALSQIEAKEVQLRLEELRKAIGSKFEDIRSIVEFKDNQPWKQWFTWTGAASVAALLYFFIPSANSTTQTQEIGISETISKALSKIDGNYAMREISDGVLVNGIRTAAIKVKDSQGQILVVSEYEPEIIDFTINLDGTLISNQLGTGEITYNERLDKITLRFKQNDVVCEFTK